MVTWFSLQVVTVLVEGFYKHIVLFLACIIGIELGRQAGYFTKTNGFYLYIRRFSRIIE